jgi:TPR repeat protein
MAVDGFPGFRSSATMADRMVKRARARPVPSLRTSQSGKAETAMITARKSFVAHAKAPRSHALRDWGALGAFALALTCTLPTTAMAETASSAWRQTISPAPITHAAPKQRQSRAQAGRNPTAGAKKARPTRVEPQSAPVKGGALGAAHVKASTLGPIMAEPTGTNAAYIAFDQSQYLTALRIAQYHAERSDSAALTLMGRIYENGLGVPKNELMAAKLYRHAAQLGDTEGLFSFAVMLAAGRGIQKNPDGAAKLFEQAARTGHAEANYNLGLLFISGIGKPENPRRAAMHLRYAAERGVAAAQYDLAALYRTGHGVKPDAYLATLWLRRAADAGMPAAQYDYAVALLQGRGLNADRPRIMEYLMAAARHAIPGAYNRLAHIYFEGQIVRKDMIEAAKWRLMARTSGLPTQPYDAPLDKAIARLPTKDLARAQRAADDFTAGARLGTPS